MSYNSKNFSVMAYANGFTLWNYATSDTLAVVKGSGYFNEIAPFARVGDMVLVNADTGRQPACAGYYFGCLHCRRCRDGQSLLPAAAA